jgi:glycosyltransferase involved in cell wall biosynthesis
MPHAQRILRVALFCDFFSSLGGTEYCNALLAAALRERGLDVRIYIGEKPRLPHWKRLLDARQIPVFEPEFFHSNLKCRKIEQQFVHRVAEDFAAWRPDIIHASPPGKLIVSWFELHARPDIPVVATECTTPSANSAHWYPAELPLFVDEIAAFTAGWEAGRAGIRAFHGFSGPIYLVRQLVTPPTDPERFTIDPANRAIGCISRLSVEKGIDYLLGAWVQIVASAPDASLHLYGQGPDEGRLRELASCLGIAGNVHFEGTFEPYVGVDEVAARHTIFVQPSLFEGLPIALLELIARKRVVIATRVGGVPELLGGHPPGGLLVAPASTEAIANAMLELVTDPGRIEAYSRVAHQKFLTHYDFGASIDATLGVYRAVLTQRLARSATVGSRQVPDRRDATGCATAPQSSTLGTNRTLREFPPGSRETYSAADFGSRRE